MIIKAGVPNTLSGAPSLDFNIPSTTIADSTQKLKGSVEI